jgi:hypothetical protein
MGPDQINGALLRLAAKSTAFCTALSHLVRFCHAFRVWPQHWRDDNKLPLLKRGKDPSQLTAYRPIAITNILARLMERVFLPMLLDKLTPVLSRWQNGFRKHRSTQQCVYFLLERVHQALARKPKGDSAALPVVFLDITQAFDSVPHDLLLLKLHSQGAISGPLLHYYRAFLSDRRFRVIAQDAISDWTPATAGVPQGAVQSPLLFALYINDLVPPNTDFTSRHGQAFNTQPGYLLYADDACIAPGAALPSIDARKQQLTAQLHHVGEWAAKWNVRFSGSKSGCVWFHLPDSKYHRSSAETQHAQVQFTIPYGSSGQTVPIPNVPTYQYLGVWLHQNLSYLPQFEHMKAAATQASNLVRSTLSTAFPPSALVVRQLCRTLILPRLTYGFIFTNTPADKLNALTGVLLQPALKVLTMPKTVHRAGFCHFLGILPLAVQRDLSLLQFAHSALRLQNVEGVASTITDYPLLADLWESLTQDTAKQAAVDLHKARRSYHTAAAVALRQITSPCDHILRACAHWGLGRLLPDYSYDPHRSTPLWDANLFLRSARQAAGLQATALWLMETRGIAVNLKGPFRFLPNHAKLPGFLRSHASVLHPSYAREPLKPKPPPRPRGTQLPELAGFAPTPTPAEIIDIFRLPKRYAHREPAELPLHLRDVGHKPFAFLTHDPPAIAKARSRLVLNRADFLAIRQANAPPRQQVCQRCLLGVPESTLHVLTECSAHAAARTLLQAKLKLQISRIYERLWSPLPAFAHLKPFRFLRFAKRNHPPNHLLFHLVSGTQPLRPCMGSNLFYHLLRLTGAFIETISRVRPI